MNRRFKLEVKSRVILNLKKIQENSTAFFSVNFFGYCSMERQSDKKISALKLSALKLSAQ